MITMNELVDLRMQQHIAHEIYRQQIMQRIPGEFWDFFIFIINKLYTYHLLQNRRPYLSLSEIRFRTF